VGGLPFADEDDEDDADREQGGNSNINADQTVSNEK
jgi:hypothetical protein